MRTCSSSSKSWSGWSQYFQSTRGTSTPFGMTPFALGPLFRPETRDGNIRRSGNAKKQQYSLICQSPWNKPQQLASANAKNTVQDRNAGIFNPTHLQFTIGPYTTSVGLVDVLALRPIIFCSKRLKYSGPVSVQFNNVPGDKKFVG